MSDFDEDSFSGSRNCPMHWDRQTDRHDEANSRFPQFCERAQKLPHPTFSHIGQINIHDGNKE